MRATRLANLWNDGPVGPPESNRVSRIVLTGGPGGGKTTAADLFRREIGDSVVVVPESATTLFAGAVFPIALLPLPLQFVGRMLPSYYAIEGLRAALLTDDPLSAWDEMLVLAVMAAVLLPLSMWALTKALRWGRISGPLSSF